MDERKTYRHQALPICTLGGAGQGKTTLTAAILRVVSRIGSAQMSAEAFAQQEPIHRLIGSHMTVNYRAVDYETSGRHYTHIDALNHADNVKMLIGGSPEIRGSILVVSPDEGVTTETEAQVRLASQVGVSAIVAFLNTNEKVKDSELLEICEMEVRELLTDCGYKEERMIIGDAAKALQYKGQNLNSEHWKPIVDLIFAMNRCMPQPRSALELPLMMPIRRVIDNPKGPSTVYGEIIQGRLSVGTAVDIVGKGERIRTRCVGLKQSSENSRESEAQVDAEPGWITPGQVILDPKQGKSYTAFRAVVYVMTPEECGTHIPLVGNDRPEIHLWTIDVAGRLRLPAELAIVGPGEHASVNISLGVPMAMQVGVRFEIKKMGMTIGMGTATEILD
jgi:elongation factor Tu